MRQKLIDVLLWTGAFIAIAVVIAAGMRVVAFLVTGSTEQVWRAALVLIAGASGGGAIVSALQSQGRETPLSDP